MMKGFYLYMRTAYKINCSNIPFLKLRKFKNTTSKLKNSFECLLNKEKFLNFILLKVIYVIYI